VSVQLGEVKFLVFLENSTHLADGLFNRLQTALTGKEVTNVSHHTNIQVAQYDYFLCYLHLEGAESYV